MSETIIVPVEPAPPSAVFQPVPKVELPAPKPATIIGTTTPAVPPVQPEAPAAEPAPKAEPVGVAEPAPAVPNPTPPKRVRKFVVLRNVGDWRSGHVFTEDDWASLYGPGGTRFAELLAMKPPPLREIVQTLDPK